MKDLSPHFNAVILTFLNKVTTFFSKEKKNNNKKRKKNNDTFKITPNFIPKFLVQVIHF